MNSTSQTPDTAPDGLLLAEVVQPSGESLSRPLYRDDDGSYATYFNAFPAAYWMAWSILDAVELRLVTDGTGTVQVYRSDAAGDAHGVATIEVAGGSVSTVRPLPLRGFDDGGWYWFALTGDVELVSGGWWAPAGTAPARPVRASIAITTLDREQYLVPLLQKLADSAELMTLLDHVFVIDHGSRRITDAPGFDDAATKLGGALIVREQPNRGGSGGFARGMMETLDAGSDAVILLDDDVDLEPESVRRLIRFEQFATVPMIVGGHMLDMASRTKLHALAEGIREDTYFWHAKGKLRHDFAQQNLREAAWLHRRIDADYTGWWMCLIPSAALRDIGLAMPYFIKWDDAEFGVRAAEAGYPTLSLPGAAIWHVSWENKDDTVGWQGYFHARNRLITALLHSPRRGGGSLPLAELALSIRYLFALEYGAQAIRNAAYRDVLAGPQGLHESLAHKLSEVRSLLGESASGVAIPPDAWAESIKTVPRSPRRAEIGEHVRGLRAVRRALPVALRNVTRVRADADTRPQAWLAQRDARWWNVGRYDSVLTESPDGAGGRWLRRDRRRAFALLRDAWRLSRRVKRAWPELATAYRTAAPDLTSDASWRRTLTP